jgi:Ser/Thr protein kinase RdoA (MazF antagonist)
VNVAQLPPKVIRHFLTPNNIAAVQQITPGMSGAEIFRCATTDGREFALKRWPDATQASRVQEVHWVQWQARERGCSFVPQLQHAALAGQVPKTFVEDAGKIWELSQWMPGAPMPADAPLELIQQGARAIGRFHAAVRQLKEEIRPQAPALVSRLTRLSELRVLLPRAIHSETGLQFSLPLRETLKETSALLSGSWDRVDQRIARSLQQHLPIPARLQYVLRDIHRDHILFLDRNAEGLIDFDAIRCDLPATDLARWGGGFLLGRADPAPVWEAVVAGFSQASPFQSEQNLQQLTMLIRDLHFSSTWISLANWAVWIRLESRTFPSGDHAIMARIEELCRLARQEM